MYSNQPNHVDAYKDWGKIKGTPVKVRDGKEVQTLMKPTFAENLRFFFTYQSGHMYMRYFMWNFVGRQNDVQGHGTFNEGNWVSGIDFLDKIVFQSLVNGHAERQFRLDGSGNIQYVAVLVFLGAKSVTADAGIA